MSEEDLKVVSYDPTGKIRFDFGEDEGGSFVLRRPTFGDFNVFNDMLTDLSTDNIRKAALLQKAEDLKDLDDDSVEMLLQVAADVKKAVAAINVGKAEIVREVFKRLGDHELPAEVGDWPMFLVTDPDLIAKMMAHWQVVPSRRG